MSTRAVKGIIAQAHKKGGPVKVTYDEAPLIYASKIVRREHEIDSHETSALKAEIAQLKSERDRYKNICMSGGSKKIIDALSKQVVDLKSDLISKLDKDEANKNKLQSFVKDRDNLIGQIINKDDEIHKLRTIIKQMSQINIELRIKVTELERGALNNQVEQWENILKDEKK